MYVGLAAILAVKKRFSAMGPLLAPQQLGFGNPKGKSLSSRILNISFRNNELAWTQATLAVGFCGLGIRSAVQLAPSAFIASAAASLDLAQRILPPRFHHLLRLSFDEPILRWENIFEQQKPPPHLMHTQKSWDALASLNILNYLINSAPDDLS